MSEYRQVEETEQGQIVLMLYDSVLQGKVSSESFSPEYWSQFESTWVLAKGRGTTYCVQSPDATNPWVLRQYKRGGLFGKLVEQSYWFTDENLVRSVAECRVLMHLSKLNLPVPKPVAAMYRRKGRIYQAAILTEYIPDTQTLSSKLVAKEEIVWTSVANAIYQVHQAGLIHNDLNAHNILLDKSGNVFIIDLDKAGYIPGINLGSQHRLSLERLRRSIKKVSTGSEEQQKKDWAELIFAYRELYTKNAS